MWNRFFVMTVVVSVIAASASLALPDQGSGGGNFSGCAYKLTPLPLQDQICQGFHSGCPDCMTVTDDGNQEFTEYTHKDLFKPEPGYDSAGVLPMPCSRIVTCALDEELQRDYFCERIGDELSSQRACSPTTEERFCRVWISTPQQPLMILDYELWPCLAGM